MQAKFMLPSSWSHGRARREFALTHRGTASKRIHGRRLLWKSGCSGSILPDQRGHKHCAATGAAIAV